MPELRNVSLVVIDAEQVEDGGVKIMAGGHALDAPSTTIRRSGRRHCPA